MRKAITAATIAALGLVSSAYAQDELSYSFLELGYVDSEIDDLDVDDNGLALGAGLRGLVSDVFELRGGSKYVDFDDADSDTTFGVGARYYFARQFVLGGDIDFNDDGTSYTLGARFDFGK